MRPVCGVGLREDMIWPAVLSVMLDRAVTVPYWSHEQNTLVEALGPLLWLCLTVVALGGLITVWFSWDLWRYRSARWLLGGITVLHLLAVGTNLLVIAGVL